MAKEPELLQPIEKLKPALMLSKKQPVPFAFALSKDGDPILFVLKKGKAKMARAAMVKAAKKESVELNKAMLRFGMAEVDKDEDARSVRFTVNRDISNSIRPKLLPLIKKCGLGKCEFTVDEKLEDEPEGEEEPEGDDEEAAPTAPVAAQDDAAQPNAKEPAAAGGDTAAVAKRLTDLVKRMMAIMGSKPAGADAMKTAAVAAQTAIKGNNVEEATKSADTLQRLLDAADQAGAGAAGGQKGGPKNGVGSPVFAKARLAWVSTRKKVEGDLEKLHKELQATYQGQGVVADLEKVFRSKVEPMMENLDSSLADKLDEVNNATDPGEHAKLVDEARAIISKFEAYLTSEPLIAKLDDNPFVPLAIEKTLSASLAALSKAVA